MRNTNINSAASTNSTRVARNGAVVWSLNAFNSGAGVAYVKIYNKGASAPVVGTDTPIAVLPVPAAGSAWLDIARAGLTCPNGIGLAITGGAADTDTTAVAAGQVKVNLGYQGTPNS